MSLLRILLFTALVACGPEIIMTDTECTATNTHMQIEVMGVPVGQDLASMDGYEITVVRHDEQSWVATIPLADLALKRHKLSFRVSNDQVHAVARCDVDRLIQTPHLYLPVALGTPKANPFLIERIDVPESGAKPVFGKSRPEVYSVEHSSSNNQLVVEIRIEQAVHVAINGLALPLDEDRKVRVTFDRNGDAWTEIQAWSVDEVERKFRLRPAQTSDQHLERYARVNAFEREHKASWAAPLQAGDKRPTMAITPLGLEFRHCDDCKRNLDRVEVIATITQKTTLIEECVYKTDDGKTLSIARFERGAQLTRYAAKTGAILEERSFSNTDASCVASRWATFKGDEHVIDSADMAGVRPVLFEVLSAL